MLPVILAGAVGGVGWALLGAAKNKTNQEHDDFSWKKFTKTVIIGAAIGGILGYQGAEVNFTAIESFVAGSAMYAPLTAIADKAVGIIWNFINKVRNV